VLRYLEEANGLVTDKADLTIRFGAASIYEIGNMVKKPLLTAPFCQKGNVITLKTVSSTLCQPSAHEKWLLTGLPIGRIKRLKVPDKMTSYIDTGCRFYIRQYDEVLSGDVVEVSSISTYRIMMLRSKRICKIKCGKCFSVHCFYNRTVITEPVIPTSFMKVEEIVQAVNKKGEACPPIPRTLVVRPEATGMYSVSCNLIFYEGGKAMVAKRSMKKKMWPGGYDFIASGMVQAEETPIAAMIREAQEEIGHTFAEQDLRLSYVWKPGEGFNSMGYVYVAQYPGQLNINEQDIDSVDWLPIMELSAMKVACKPDFQKYFKLLLSLHIVQ